MAIPSKTRLGTYEIVALLGAGGMGEVYRAKDLRLGREVAVKVLPEGVVSTDRLARFEREARTVAALNHPNIVVLYSIEEEDGIRFLTMEFVQGQSLSKLVTPGGLPLSRVLELTIPLADALAAAHERGIIHRDLKPANVMVTREGLVKVLDFGLAKIAESVPPALDETASTTMDTPLSHEGQVLGTVPYMAPEQLRGDAVDPRSDIFALGVILYELATGRRPFTGETSIDVGHAILRDTPEALTKVRLDLGSDLERIVSQCLEKNPRERAQTALDVGNALRRVSRIREPAEPDKPASRMDASIAVLPFVNRSADPEDEYFSDGLADELLNMLTKIRGLRVVARTSSFLFKATKDDIATMGRKLNVATLLEGTVRKAGNRVRISVQLVKVPEGHHLWSETYDRTLEDIFEVQDDIARSVVEQLHGTLLGETVRLRASGDVKAEVARAAQGRATDSEAHRLYLQGQHLIDRSTREGVAKGIEYLKRASIVEPGFALVWIELARAYTNEASSGWATGTEAFERAREAVERALSLEPDLAVGHVRRAWLQMNYDWDWKEAEASYRKALGLAPENVSTLRLAAVLAARQGHLVDAIEFNRRSLEHDPLSSGCYNNLGMALQSAGRFEQAEEAYRRALDLSPGRVSTHARLSLALLQQGQGERALAEARRESEEPYRLWALAIIHHVQEHRAESDEALRLMVERYGGDSGFHVAEILAVRGDIDSAFESLESAYTQRDVGLAGMKVSLHLHPLHADPRWGALLKKMGFE